MTIVVGYTPTPQGDAALTFALDEADRRGEGLYVLNTSRGDKLVDPRFADDGQLADARQRLEESGVDFELHQRVDGQDASDHVLQAAEDLGASAIVIGIRRRTATGKLLFGSEAQSILLQAECPVLTVKAPRS